MRKGSSVAAEQKKDSLWQSICKHKGLYLMALPGFIWFVLFKYVPLAGAVIAFRLFRPYPAQGKNYAYVEEEMSAIVELCRVGIVEELKRAGMG